ncbi:hypothetical protein GGI35DRAFT_462485 [Trichoderma velutinum]
MRIITCIAACESLAAALQSEAQLSAVKSRAHARMRWQSPPFGGEAAAEWPETSMQNAPRNNGVQVPVRGLDHSVLQRFLVVGGGAPRDPQGIVPL